MAQDQDHPDVCAGAGGVDWVARYVGTPYFDGQTGLVCWGLVCLVYREQLGIELPEYAEVDHKLLGAVQGRIEASVVESDWKIVCDAPRAFDVAILIGWMKDSAGVRRRGICHVGVMAGPDRLLHLDRPHDAVVVPVHHHTVRHRIQALYRHERAWK